MSRATRRARRRMRRGDARREPLLILADEHYAGEYLEALARWAYRYRSEAAPVLVMLALAVVGSVLHSRHPGWAPLVAFLGAAAAVLVGWHRATPTLRRIERAYAAGVTAAASGWLALATAHGPAAGPLRGVLIFGGTLAAIPWWGHRRRRARVRVERTLEAWPFIADAIGVPGSTITSAVVDLWGWRARIRLRRGQTVADLVSRVTALESGLGTRPGAVRVEADPARADRALIRVLDADPHARAIPWPDTFTTDERSSITDPVPLGLFEDARPVAVTLVHRHGLIGGVAGAGKSGVLNVILATLAACPDVVLWGIDLKGGMEFGPWAGCLNRLAINPREAAELLGEAVAVLEARAKLLADDNRRLWTPTADAPALVIVIDEYAELTEEAADALAYADSIARRGRAVAVTLLVATQRPTQKAMGAGAVRSQMDVRICLRVRERRDVDLILGQGMLAAGWNAESLDAPGKFLVSTPEHTTPRRARAYLLTDDDVHTAAVRWSRYRPLLDTPSQEAADDHATAREVTASRRTVIPRPRPPADEAPLIERVADASLTPDEAAEALWAALTAAPDRGLSVADLMAATGMRKTWIYGRLQDHAENGRAVQVRRGRWRAATSPDTNGNDTDEAK